MSSHWIAAGNPVDRYLNWRCGRALVLQPSIIKKAKSSCHTLRLNNKYCGLLVSRAGIRYRWSSDRLWCSSHKPLKEAKPTGPQGIILFGFPSEEVEAVRKWLSEIDLKVVSGDGKLRKSSSVSEALSLLTKPDLPVQGDTLKFLTRVVLFSGLSGDEMEGLVDIWGATLGNVHVSYGYITSQMMEDSIERVLIKIISASDENDLAQNLASRLT